MEHRVLTETLRGMSHVDRHAMFRLRYDTFKVRLGWDVETTDDGLEVDAFDSVPEASYIIAKSPASSVDGCWRLLPTLGPNMLRDLEVFHCLLDGAEPPAAADVWELSRFALNARAAQHDGVESPQFNFGPLSIALMAEAARFAQARGISRYVTITTAAIERLLKRQGLHIHRLGSPKRIGQVLTVACFIEVDEITLAAVAGN